MVVYPLCFRSFLLLAQKKRTKEKGTTKANPKFSFYTRLALLGSENLWFAPLLDPCAQEK
jgi:hypothetical protein